MADVMSWLQFVVLPLELAIAAAGHLQLQTFVLR